MAVAVAVTVAVAVAVQGSFQRCSWNQPYFCFESQRKAMISSP